MSGSGIYNLNSEQVELVGCDWKQYNTMTIWPKKVISAFTGAMDLVDLVHVFFGFS